MARQRETRLKWRAPAIGRRAYAMRARFQKIHGSRGGVLEGSSSGHSTGRSLRAVTLPEPCGHPHRGVSFFELSRATNSSDGRPSDATMSSHLVNTCDGRSTPCSEKSFKEIAMSSSSSRP